MLENPLARRLVDEGMAAAPRRFLGEDTVQLLPRKRLTGSCRICGARMRLTKEHIPPKKSGNSLRHSSHSHDEWTSTGSLEIPEAGRIRQGGIFGYTLCSKCNSLTGKHYGDEYKRWALATAQAISAMPPPTVLDERAQPFGWTLQLGSVETGGVRPGAFVRQVLSMMCTLSGSWDLAGTHPEVRSAIVDMATEDLSKNLGLGMGLFLGPRIRIMGPQLHVDPSIQTWRWLMEMAFPPFAFLFALASNSETPVAGLTMTDWVTYRPEEELKFEGLLEVGFGWTPYPGDYRSKTAIEGSTEVK
jgi:hypothetical protein